MLLGDKMKICLVAPIPPPYGGIANWTMLLKAHIQKQSDVQLLEINTAPKKRTLDGRTLFDRVVVQGLAMLKHNRALKSLITKEKPDTVHITTSGQLAVFRDTLLLSTAKKRSVHSVYHIHFGRIPEIAHQNTAEWKRIKKAMLLSDNVIAIDKKTEAAIQKYAPEVSVCYIPNPFDLEKLEQKRILPRQNRKEEIVFLGWVVNTKGIEELLSAWALLSSEYPEHTLRVIGPCSADYLHYLKSHFPCENVVFDGEKEHDEALDILASGEVFVLPSYTEGFPNAVLEAMALELPIVATDVGAIPDMLEGCGMVIPAQNPQALYEALRAVLSSPGESKALAKKARLRLENNYCIDCVFNAYKSIWTKGHTYDL